MSLPHRAAKSSPGESGTANTRIAENPHSVITPVVLVLGAWVGEGLFIGRVFPPKWYMFFFYQMGRTTHTSPLFLEDIELLFESICLNLILFLFTNIRLFLKGLSWL